MTERTEAGALVVEGGFAAVFDAAGARVADRASVVSIADGEVSVLR